MSKLDFTEKDIKDIKAILRCVASEAPAGVYIEVAERLLNKFTAEGRLISVQSVVIPNYGINLHEQVEVAQELYDSRLAKWDYDGSATPNIARWALETVVDRIGLQCSGVSLRRGVTTDYIAKIRTGSGNPTIGWNSVSKKFYYCTDEE